MMFWILASFLISLAGSTETAKLSVDPHPSIRIIEEKDDLVRFDLDFGFYEIRQAQAYLNDRFPSIRLPVSISKNGMANEEIDFADPNTKPAILDLLKKISVASIKIHEDKTSKKRPSIRLTWLEKINSSKGIRLAKGELWLDGQAAVRFSLMKSKWSQSPRSWWVAFPARWREDSNYWEDLFVIKDKSLKKEIIQIVREAYLDRYYEEE